MINFNYYLRKLAKKSEILNQFVASKEINGIRFFENELNFSKLQNTFVSYLYFYYNLYQDIAMKKVSEKVLNNEIYENAYSYYKSKEENIKKEGKTNTTRKFSGIFSKDNKIKFPEKEGI